jgi:8-amino-7-oxononanoate synthase
MAVLRRKLAMLMPCSMNPVDQHLTDKLEERRQAGNLRRLNANRAAIDLYSNDYLGLAATGALAALMRTTQDEYSTGSTGSRLLSGNSAQAEALEHTIASFHKAEAALLFNSGYDANIGLLASIADKHTTILYDELCHASIIDGARLSLSTRRYKFSHNNTGELADKLKKFSSGWPVLVVVESVYSMDGDMAPLAAIAALCEQYSARLIVDEAHATGVFGARGEGLVCALGLQDKIFARVHTFGKALGCHGAAVVGNDLLKQYLVNFARSFIYTTALPGHSLHAIHCAYEHLSSHSFSNKLLHDLITYFRGCVAESSMEGWQDSISAIQALVTRDNERSIKLAERLQQAGLQVNAILHPTVPSGKERLRICLHTFNTTQQVDQLFELLRDHA